MNGSRSWLHETLADEAKRVFRDEANIRTEGQAV